MQYDPGDESTPQEWGVVPNKPTKPAGKIVCPYCGGTKRIYGPREKDNAMYCDKCSGLWLQFGATVLTLSKKADDGR